MRASLILSLITGCFNPNFQQGVPCSDDGECPEGQFCAADNRCYDEGTGPDGGSLNANAALESLLVSRGELVPPFDPDVSSYELVLPLDAEDLIVTPTAAVPLGVTIEVSGQSVVSGTPTAAISLGLGDNLLEVIVTPEAGASRTYSLAARRGPGILQQAYLKASNTEGGDGFGGSFGLAMDGDTLAVGALFEDGGTIGVGGDQTDNSAIGAGAVYVFTRSGDSWVQQAYLKASNTEASDQFGSRLALSGDTLVVSALNEASDGSSQANDSAEDAGAVYVFTRSGISWSQQAYLKASNAEAGDRFGSAVAIDGDTLAVGAFLEDSNAIGVDGDKTNNSAIDSGAVYIFARNGAIWSEQAYVKPSNTDAGDRFGQSLDLEGDTLVVGAPLEASNAIGINGDDTDDSRERAGGAYLFSRDGETWSQVAYIKASNTDAGDNFGTAVALSGDIIAIAATGEDSNAVGIDGNQADNSEAGSGAVYTFVRNGSSLSQEAYIKASKLTSLFGSRIALSRDVLVVGTVFDASSSTGVNGAQTDDGATNAGAAYLVTRRDGSWSQQAYIKASNTDAFDQFGSSVAVSGGTIVVGAFKEASSATGVGGGPAEQNDNSASQAGAVYVFQ